MKLFILTIIISTFSLNLNADSQIVTRDGSGNTSTFTSNGKMARIDDSSNPGYVLMDFKTDQVFSIDPANSEILDMSGMNGMKNNRQQAGAAAMPRVKVKVVKKSTGPKIAGYKTRQFDILANGQYCGTIFGSKKASKKKGVKQIFEAMQTLQQQTQKMTAGLRGMMDVCSQADLQLSSSLKKTGVPMRMLDQRGQLESEIIRINSKASTKPDHYQLPANYKTTNIQEKMQQANQQMQQQMPDMNNFMQQMQQQQGLPPEAMEQMKKMQEMFKNQFQQQ